MGRYAKALLCRAFFVVPPFCLGLPVEAFTACEPAGAGDWVSVAYVYDGDTLLLEDGRKVRLIGINTPELGRDGSADEAYASEARQQLQAIVETNQGRLLMSPGRQERDRYHRVLAHFYDEAGTNITARLLAAGVGFSIAIPPNLTHLDCYLQAEGAAREGLQGLWQRQPVVAGSQIKRNETGFHLIKGEIERVGRSRRAVWLNLRDGPALRIERNDWLSYFPDWDTHALTGRSLEARGWITGTQAQQRMRIHHPSAIRWLD